MSKASSWTSVFDTKMISRFFPVFTKVGVLFFVVFLVSYIAYLFLLSDHDVTGTDYVVYLTGARIVQSGNGGFLYDEIVQKYFQKEVISPFPLPVVLPFLSLPYVLVFYLPYSAFSLFLGYRLFLVVNLLVLGIFLWLSKNVFPGLAHYSFWYLVPFSSFAVLHVILLGQITLVMLLLFLLFYAFLKKKQYWAAGFWFGLFVFIKLQYLVALPFFFLLTKRKSRFFFGLLTSSLLVILVNVWLTSFEALYSYPEFLFNSRFLYSGHFNSMFSLYSAFTLSAKVMQIPLELGFMAHWFVYAAVFFVFIKRYAVVSLERAFAVATCFMLVFSVYAFDHDFVLLLVPVLILLDMVAKKRDRLLSVGFVVAVLLLSLPVLFLIEASFLAPLFTLVIGLWLLVVRANLSKGLVAHFF